MMSSLENTLTNSTLLSTISINFNFEKIYWRSPVFVLIFSADLCEALSGDDDIITVEKTKPVQPGSLQSIFGSSILPRKICYCFQLLDNTFFYDSGWNGTHTGTSEGPFVEKP